MREINIGWSPKLTGYEASEFLELVTDKPEKVVAQQITKGTINWCPAYANYYKNVFAIKFPFDIIINKINGKLSLDMTPNIPKIALDTKFSCDRDDFGYNCQIALSNLFVSDVPNTIVETMPPILHGLREEFTYLNGRYDCHAWQRPLHFGFRISQETFDQMNEEDGIAFSKGEVAMYVRFNTPKGEKVTLHQFSDADLAVVTEYVKRNTSITNHITRFNLTEIINRVRYRRPKKFLRDLHYGET